MGGVATNTVFELNVTPVKIQVRQDIQVGSMPTDFEKSVLAELAVLYRVSRRLGCGPDEAEDLVQATVLKAFKNWHQFDGRYLRSWLIRILRNERLAALRVLNPETLRDELSEDTPDNEPFWATVANNLEVERILVELNNLPEPYRLAVQLCDVEQMTYEEAAASMEVPVGTVRSRLFRARVELRRKLGAHSED